MAAGWRRQHKESTHFERGEHGELLYTPFGTTGLYSRRTYVVRDEAMKERMLDTDLEWGGRIGIALVALLVLVLAPLAFGSPNMIMVLGLGTALLVVTVACNFIRVRLVLGAAGEPLPAGPRRSLRQIGSANERIMGSNRNVWLFIIATWGIALLASYSAYAQGHPLIAFADLLALMPLLAFGPYVLRVRKLRVENARLEGLVGERTRELKELNRTLEQRVSDQVRDIERLGQLKHFFSAPVAEMILDGKGFDPAKVHRRELTAVSIDLRGFTSFSETSEPEEVISVLRVYHAELGMQVNRCQATLEHFAGDGVMIFLNDPIEVADHPMRALELALALRTAMRPHLDEWRSHGFDVGLGIGIATGYATIGAVGYEGRWEYAAIGTVCNLAARLCAEAKDGQVVVSKRFTARMGERARWESLGERALKGLARPVAMFNVLGLEEKTPAVA